METETTNTTSANPSPMPPPNDPTDDELREKQRMVREEARRRGDDKLFAPARQIATTLPDDLRLLADVDSKVAEVLSGSDSWEPECVTCHQPIGYTSKRGYYAENRTLCDRCRGDSLDDRLKASGISFREINQELSALRNHGPDGRPYGPEYDRWLAFLGRFAALKPGERIDPPFAFVYGSNGVGKSAGSERALRDAIRSGCSGRAVTFRDLVRKITSSYGASKKDEINDSADEIVRTFAGVHLLVVHEVGLEDHTDHNYGLFYDFVDARWKSCLPTIFDSNYAPGEDSLGSLMTERTSDDTKMRAIIDRLSGGFTKNGKAENLFLLRGASWRGKEITA